MIATVISQESKLEQRCVTDLPRAGEEHRIRFARHRVTASGRIASRQPPFGRHHRAGENSKGGF
jgi:hypothetical protein